MLHENRAAIALLVCAATLPAQQWTEAAVVEKFLDQNPISRESRARVAIADAEVRTRSAYANPTVSFSHEGAGRTDFYQASQALPLTGRLPLIRQAGLSQGKALEAEGAFSLWQAKCNLRLSFYRMLATQLKLSALKDSLTELNRAISILETREKEGEGSKLDRLRAQRERHEIDAELSFLDSMLATERGSLLAYLPAGESIEELAGDLAIRTTSLDTAELLRKTLATRADIQAERQRIEQYRMEQRAADRLRYPEPVLNAGLKRAELGQPSITNGPVIGLSMAIPIFQKGKSEVSRFAAEQERATARLDILVRRTQATLDAAARVFNIRKAALDKYPASGREIVEIATIAYQEGETGILQLLDAYRVDRQSRLRRIDLEAATREAWLTLESVVGEELPR